MDPDNVIVVPTGSPVELKVTVGLSVKVVEAVLWVGVTESENVTVLLPVVCDGTVKIAAANEPVEVVLVVPLRITATPPNVAVNAELAPNPEPDKVTDEPPGPVALTGLIIVIEDLTVKVAEA